MRVEVISKSAQNDKKKNTCKATRASQLCKSGRIGLTSWIVLLLYEVVYCQWNHIFLKFLPKENHASLKMGRKEVRWWLWKVQRAHTGFNNCVPLTGFAAEGMLSCCFAEFASKITWFNFKLSEVKSKVTMDRSELKGCRVVDGEIDPCCFTLGLLTSPHPTMAELPAGMHI